jgi:hypothetical protein
MSIPWVNWGWKPKPKEKQHRPDFSSSSSDFYKAQDEYQKCLENFEKSLLYEQMEKYYAVKMAAQKVSLAHSRMEVFNESFES